MVEHVDAEVNAGFACWCRCKSLPSWAWQWKLNKQLTINSAVKNYTEMRLELILTIKGGFVATSRCYFMVLTALKFLTALIFYRDW